jgi:hypothetical protein
VCWNRGPKGIATKFAPIRKNVADFGNEKISLLSSLYHDAKSGTFERKTEKLFVKDVCSFPQSCLFSWYTSQFIDGVGQTSGRVFCTVSVDLSEFISLDGTMYTESLVLGQGKGAPVLKVCVTFNVLPFPRLGLVYSYMPS